MPRSDLEFFRARAAQSREEGRLTTLDHVRERCERSEAAWNALVAREERVIRDRESRDRRKAEAGEAADMLRDRATECRDIASRSRTQVAKDAFNLLADQLDRQAVSMNPLKRS